MGDRGRLVVPAELRDRAGLREGRPLVFLETPDGLLLLTREQLLAQELRVPPGCTSANPERSLADQRRIAADLAARLAGAERLAEGIRAELAAIEAIPAALLREAFAPPSAPGDGEEA